MQENLLAPTNIILFGRVFPGLNIANVPATLGANRFLREQLMAGGGAANAPGFARIYAISYEGTFYNLPKPAIYLVHGPGSPVRGRGKTRHPGPAGTIEAGAQGAHAAAGVGAPAKAAAGGVAAGVAAQAAAEAANQPTVDDTGVIAEDFDLESDVLFWEYDKGDFTLRIDITSGTFDDVLLEAALSVTARDALVSRSDLTSRSDLASRSDLTSRSDITSRSDLTARHRLKG
jgi:hypothetical protein